MAMTIDLRRQWGRRPDSAVGDRISLSILLNLTIDRRNSSLSGLTSGRDRLKVVLELRSSPDGTSHRVVDLLVGAYIFLKGCESRRREFQHIVHICRAGMMRATNARHSKSALLVKLDTWHRVSSAHLHRRDVESED